MLYAITPHPHPTLPPLPLPLSLLPPPTPFPESLSKRPRYGNALTFFRMTFNVTKLWQEERWIDTTKESSSKSLHWLFCKDNTVPINRTRRASSIAMDPRMQKRKSVIKKTGLEELKKELEMDEHQIHLEELATRLGTDLNSVSACGSVCTGPFWQLCSLNWLQSWSCIWYGSAYNIKWYIPPTPLSLSPLRYKN